MVRKENRYSQKRKHKRILKKKYGHGLFTVYRSNVRLYEAECRDKYGNEPNARNGGYEYWQSCYLTGPRQYAKSCTNSAIRAMYRDLLNTVSEEDMDEVQALNGSDYSKVYDYDWTIW